MATEFRTTATANTGTTAVTVYTASAGISSSTIIGFSIANVGTSTIEVDARISINGAANAVHLVKDAPVPVGGALVVAGGDQKLVLKTNDELIVQSNTASSADSVISILESS